MGSSIWGTRQTGWMEPPDYWNYGIGGIRYTSDGKSIPLHCVVETEGGTGTDKCGQTNVELDTYAILPGTTAFSDVVRTALIKIGYTASEALGTKGTIQFKNWKPLSFDSVTDNPNATVEDILGELTSVATLRIRLCSQPKLYAMEELKEKLLQILLQKSHNLLLGSGCPIEKKLLWQISEGDCPQTLPDETREAFNKWYKDQVTKSKPDNRPPPTSTADIKPPVTSQTPTSISTFPVVVKPENNLSPNFSFARTRMRTSFDPEHEIPRLQKWFTRDQHPSREQMVAYLGELNALESRKGRKPLDLTNIIYWFKNARAAQRRAFKTLDNTMMDGHNGDNIDHEESMDVDDNVDEDRLSPSSVDHVPVLPNRNAVYIVSPLLSKPDKDQVEVVRVDESSVEETQKNDSSSADPVENGSNQDKDSTRNDDSADENQNRGSIVSKNIEQDHATDLSVRNHHSRRTSTDSTTTQDSAAEKGEGRRERSTMDNLQLKTERETEQGYLSSTPTTPSPTENGSSDLHPEPHQYSQLQHQLQQQQHVLQMAAMSHALNMQYMHPGALYSPPVVNSPSYKDLSHSPSSSGSESALDKKKRSRVFIDPLSEIPKLEKWFIEDTHPSSYMIEKYTDDLNRSAYRLRFPKLEPKNVQLWFKNHRAKVKRQRLDEPSP